MQRRGYVDSPGVEPCANGIRFRICRMYLARLLGDVLWLRQSLCTCSVNASADVMQALCADATRFCAESSELAPLSPPVIGRAVPALSRPRLDTNEFGNTSDAPFGGHVNLLRRRSA